MLALADLHLSVDYRGVDSGLSQATAGIECNSFCPFINGDNDNDDDLFATSSDYHHTSSKKPSVARKSQAILRFTSTRS